MHYLIQYTYSIWCTIINVFTYIILYICSSLALAWNKLTYEWWSHLTSIEFRSQVPQSDQWRMQRMDIIIFQREKWAIDCVLGGLGFLNCLDWVTSQVLRNNKTVEINKQKQMVWSCSWWAQIILGHVRSRVPWMAMIKKVADHPTWKRAQISYVW